METVQEFLDVYLDIGEDDFLSRFDHPFLLFPEKQSAGGFASYHTQMANRSGGARIAGTGREIRNFRVLPEETREGVGFAKKLIVGRAPEREISIDHSTVSKRHAFLVFDEDKESFRLGDAGSTNGTFVNGHVVDAGDPVFLRDGYLVSFGEVDFMFFSPTGFLDLLKRLKAEGV